MQLVSYFVVEEFSLHGFLTVQQPEYIRLLRLAAITTEDLVHASMEL